MPLILLTLFALGPISLLVHAVLWREISRGVLSGLFVHKVPGWSCSDVLAVPRPSPSSLSICQEVASFSCPLGGATSIARQPLPTSDKSWSGRFSDVVLAAQKAEGSPDGI